LLLLFEGYAVGPHYNQGGSGSNFLCLHEDPQWRTYREGDTISTGSIFGVEYSLHQSNDVFSKSNNGGNSLHNNPAPCAVCYVGGRSTILMIPARTQCPDGWTMEYGGYLVSEVQNNARKRSSYICLDEAGTGSCNWSKKSRPITFLPYWSRLWNTSMFSVPWWQGTDLRRLL